jgi:hypothetical protein
VATGSGKFTVISAGGEPRLFEKDAVYIGRLTSCEVLLDDSTVSRIHASITFNDGRYTLVNLSKGNILTLTDRQAAKEYGDPPKPLLSSGTVESLDALLTKLGYASAQRVEIKPTGAEQLGAWINTISPLLLIVGIIGLYIEFKTPGFGLPGVIGIAAFVVYFLGGYIAGLSAPAFGTDARGSDSGNAAAMNA